MRIEGDPEVANEISRKLKSLDDFKEAFDCQWNLIDSGDEEARLNLAHLFDDLGLHFFSQDQYLYLLENQPEFALEAAYGAVCNYVWFREYHLAKELLAQYSELPESLNAYVIDSEAEYSTLNKNPEQIEHWVSQAMKDRDLVDSNFSSNHSLESLTDKLYIEELFLNLAIDINLNPNSLISSMSLDVPVSADTWVPTSLAKIVGSPVDRARDYMRTCSLVILNLFESKDKNLFKISSFAEACNVGKKVANKFIWLMNEYDFTEEDVTTFGNICWGLERMQEANLQYVSIVLNSYIQDQISDGE